LLLISGDCLVVVWWFVSGSWVIVWWLVGGYLEIGACLVLVLAMSWLFVGGCFDVVGRSLIVVWCLGGAYVVGVGGPFVVVS